MAMQYVEVKFRPWDKRAYTYHWDGEPLNIGQTVRVETRDGWQAVEVVGVSEVKPPFPTKPISLEPPAQDVPPPRKRVRRDDTIRQQGDLLGGTVGWLDADGEIQWPEDQ